MAVVLVLNPVKVGGCFGGVVWWQLMKLVFPDEFMSIQYEYPPLDSCPCFECNRATEAAEQVRVHGTISC
jgi:hypothetical protein